MRDWLSFPPLPTSVFKRMPITCFPLAETQHCFHTSGTTGHTPGRHYFRDLSLYQRSARAIFRRLVLRDLPSPLPILILDRPFALQPRSSLAFMWEIILHSFGTADSGFYHRTTGPDYAALLEDLERHSREGRPIILMGTTLALWDFCDFLEAQGALSLPSGSLLVDTGGFKRRPARTRNIVIARYQRLFGVDIDHIVNEYGMTELTSQFYDGHRLGIRAKVGPPWCRAFVVDPTDPQRPAEEGLLRIVDLMNLDSCLSLQTLDHAVARREGFEIIGRWPGAEPRGCSLAVEAFLREAQ